MKKNIVSCLKTPDHVLSHLYLKFFQERNALIIVGFHGVFRDEEERSLNLVEPSTWINLDHLRRLIEYYLHHGYTFISPHDILSGLDVNKKYIMITFDDGYFNNSYVLPLLREYKIPAVFFVSTSNILDGKCFWWDVLYRERKKQGVSGRKIRCEIEQLKTKKSGEIEGYLKGVFGADAFKPYGDIDRPFASSELKSFSKEKHVFLGNHTHDHAILTNYSLDEVRVQIGVAQNVIHDITGVNPVVISYPNGSYSDEVIKVSEDVGLRLGVTVNAEKNFFPLDCSGGGCMRLGRFVYMANMEVEKQCELFRSDLLFYTLFSKFGKGRVGGL